MKICCFCRRTADDSEYMCAPCEEYLVPAKICPSCGEYTEADTDICPECAQFIEGEFYDFLCKFCPELVNHLSNVTEGKHLLDFWRKDVAHAMA